MLYLLLLACMLLGYVIQQPWILGQRGASTLLSVLNRWILWVALPSLILLAVPSLEFSSSYVFAACVPWCIFVFFYLLFKQFSFGFDRDQRLVLTLLLSLGNTAFLGAPLIREVLGESVTLGAIIYDQFGSFLVLSTVAVGLIATHHKSTDGDALMPRFVKILKFPPFVTLLVALLLPADYAQQFFGESISGVVNAMLVLFAASLTPLAVLTVGLQFQLNIEAAAFRLIRWVVGLKMLLAPVAVFAAAKLFAVEADVAVASVIQTAMPPMITGVVMLANAGIAPRLSVSVLAVCTLVAAASLPLWFYLAQFY